MFDMFFPGAADFPLPPPPSWVQPSIAAACILSILLPSGPIRISSGGIILGLFFYIYAWTATNELDGYSAGTGSIALVFRWIDIVLIHHPERDFWRTAEVDGKDMSGRVIVEGRAPEGSWAKLKWFTDLWLSARGVGWNMRVSQMPAAAPKAMSISLWVIKNIVRLFLMYLGMDIASSVLIQMGHGAPFFDQPVPWQVCFSWAKAFRSYYMIEIVYYIIAIPMVAFDISTPQEWPPITGSFRKDAYTVRKMWGTCWHQLMRRPCSEGGRIFKQLFGLKKGSFASRYSQIWIAFLISTIVHHAGAVVAMFEDGGYWQIVYFMIQPVGIMAEDFTIYLGKKMGFGESVWSRSIGFVWVIVWFSWSLRFMVAYQPYLWTESHILPSLSKYLIDYWIS
ncbi:membrane bound O-acyl transferase family-domain-containing protein [Rhexocercosporidium sp. MPI-PUGE-AT-0058]|nr:membrane bound O-acyl transferase family-domain-containing protein [Rhexocercosporidium sp. MPI-PUGE-AT-0058]